MMISCIENSLFLYRKKPQSPFPPVVVQGNNPIATIALTSEPMEEGAARRTARRTKLSKYIERGI